MSDIHHQIIVKDKSGSTVGQFSDWFSLRFSDQINYFGECSFQVPVTSRDAENLIALRLYEIDITEDGVVVWSGEQANADVILSANSPEMINITCYTYPEMLNARVTDEYIRFDQVDQAQILKSIIDISQAETDGDFGFTFATIVPTMLRDREYRKDNIFESMVNMSNVINGIDFWIDNNKVIHFGAPRRGEDKSNQFGFEHGINVREMRISDNFSTPANRVFAIGSTDGFTPFIRSYTDATTRAIYKLREQTISAIDVSEEATLIAKAQELVTTNKNQRRTIRISQMPNTTPKLSQVDLGDYLRAKVNKGRYDISFPFRLLGYECVVGEVGESYIDWILSDFQGV